MTAAEVHAAVSAIMAGDAPEAVIAAFLTALRMKGESAEEVAGAVEAVRERSQPWEDVGLASPLLDTCGTGGDGANTVNVSTATAIVVASCGVPVAKHGNRSASGNSGSAEVLAELGIAIEAEPPALRRCLAELGLTFLFAPRFHPALRFAAPVRRQLPFRTLFNLLGPLVNPARPEFQLVGVAGERQADLMAEALVRLGARRAAVVTGSDGLDEVTLDGPTRVLWVERGCHDAARLEPRRFRPAQGPRVRAPGLRTRRERLAIAGAAPRAGRAGPRRGAGQQRGGLARRRSGGSPARGRRAVRRGARFGGGGTVARALGSPQPVGGLRVLRRRGWIRTRRWTRGARRGEVCSAARSNSGRPSRPSPGAGSRSSWAWGSSSGWCSIWPAARTGWTKPRSRRISPAKRLVDVLGVLS